MSCYPYCGCCNGDWYDDGLADDGLVGTGVVPQAVPFAMNPVPFPFASSRSVNGSIRNLTAASNELDQGLCAIEARARRLRTGTVRGLSRYWY